MAAIRLNKFIAEAGVASRRGADELIRLGRITVNGEASTEMGVRVDPATDDVRLDGILLTPASELIYCMLHKPAGCLTTVTDTHGRKTVMDYVQDIPQRIFPVGRLDLETEGLLILTNDGNLSHSLTHPRYKIEKEYLVWIDGHADPSQIALLRSGIPLEGRMTAAADVQVESRNRKGDCLRMTIREGRKRQIRLMIQHTGYNVKRLLRVRVGPLSLGKLPSGKWEYLTSGQLGQLRDEIQSAES